MTLCSLGRTNGNTSIDWGKDRVVGNYNGTTNHGKIQDNFERPRFTIRRRSTETCDDGHRRKEESRDRGNAITARVAYTRLLQPVCVIEIV
jgi:hypothetical protein